MEHAGTATPPPADAGHHAPGDLLLLQQRLRRPAGSPDGELELRPLLARILKDACALVLADRGAITLLDPTAGVLRVEAVHKLPQALIGTEQPPSGGLAADVVRARSPVARRADETADPTGSGAVIEPPALGVPIDWHDDALGALVVGFRRDHAVADGGDVDGRTADVLRLFAHQAAIAIESELRLHREQRRRGRLELIARMGRILTGNLGLDELLRNAAEAIREVLGYPNVVIFLVEPDDPPRLVARGAVGQWGSKVNDYRIAITEGIIGTVARERRAIRVNDVSRDPRYHPTPGAPTRHAELALPILLSDQVTGVLDVESEQPFNEEDEVGLRIVADQLAAGIQNARLYEIGQRLAVIEERQRIARELHDSVTQQLFAVSLIAGSLASAWRRDPEEAERRTARIVQLSGAALAEMRALLAELRPVDGDSEPDDALGPAGAGGMERVRRDGLARTLHAYAVDTLGDAIQVTLDADGYTAQPPAVEFALYRIGQEALHNVLKHAGARGIALRLESADRVRLRVEDDGRGFAADDGLRRGALGLQTMRERAQALGGELHVRSTPGSGTVVEAVLPVPGVATPAQR